MLGYLPVVLRATQPTYENKHHFVCATSGFNSVNMLEFLESRKNHQVWDEAEIHPSRS